MENTPSVEKGELFFFKIIDEMFLFGLFVLGQRVVFFKENDEVKGRR